MNTGTCAALSIAERLRELTWAGFTPEDIAGAAGCAVDLIEGLYEAGSGGDCAANAVRRAWRQLMPPDVDEIAVEHVLDGDYPPRHLTIAERREAVRLLVLSRCSSREIAERLGITDRTVGPDRRCSRPRRSPPGPAPRGEQGTSPSLHAPAVVDARRPAGMSVA